MSLLNDALRKNRSEQQPPADDRLKASLPKPAGNTGRASKRQWIVVAGVLVTLAVAGAAWLYVTIADMGSDLSTGSAPVDMPVARPVVETEQTPVDPPPSVAPTAVSTKPPPAEATPVKPPPPGIIPYKWAVKSKALKEKITPPVPAKPAAPDETRAAPSPGKEAGQLQRREKSSSRSVSGGSGSTIPAPRDAQTRLRIDSLYQKARQYHRESRIEQAIVLYQEVIKIDPEHGKARFNLSAAYLQTGAYKQAYTIIADLHRKEPNNHQVMLNLAIAHIGCQRYPEAIDLLDQTTRLPGAPQFEIAFHKGVAYSHWSRPLEAIDWYKRAEAIQPDDLRLLFNLAVVHDQQENYGLAVEYYYRYLDANPEIDASKKKQIRRRIRTLLSFKGEPKLRESNPQ